MFNINQKFENFFPVSLKNYKAQIFPIIKNDILMFKEKGVVIWGLGSSAAAFYHALVEFDCDSSVIGFCDSFSGNESPDYLNKKVYSAIDAANKYPNAIFAIGSSAFKPILSYIRKESNLKSIFTYHFDPSNKSNFHLFTFASVFLRLVLGEYSSYVCNYYKHFEYFCNLQKQDNLKSECKVLSLFEDEDSKTIIKNRIDFFANGNISAICSIPDAFEGREYYEFFSKQLAADEVFFDCGAFTGDSIADFLDAVNGSYKSIVAFEPDKKSHLKLTQFANEKALKNITCINAGTGIREEKLCFTSNGGAGEMFTDTSNGETVSIVPLDKYIKFKPSLIKMDIEGFELDALKGAENTIKELKPKLAICLYHKPMDLIEIPLYLKSLVPEYKFSLRQHCPSKLYDVVLYAEVD